MDSAAQTVFATAELLEQILLELPIRSLARSKMTAKRWSDTITSSPKLRGRLTFREPLPSDLMTLPLKDIGYRQVTMLHPMFPERILFYPLTIHTCGARSLPPFLIKHQPLLDLSADYQDMFVCQPPTRLLSIYLYIPRNASTYNKTIENDKGIKFGEVQTRLRKALEESREYPGSMYARYRQDESPIVVHVQIGKSLPDTHQTVARDLKDQYGRLP